MVERDEPIGEKPEVVLLTNGEMAEREGDLLRRKGFLVEVAEACDREYREGEMERLTSEGDDIPDWLRAPLFSGPERALLVADTSTFTHDQVSAYNTAQAKLAMGLSGLYALSEGLGIVTMLKPGSDTERHDTLVDLTDGTADDPQEAELFSRLAHATWAAGQPFRNRETRPVMQVFDTLPASEKTKDIGQIVAAAKVLNKYLDAAPQRITPPAANPKTV